MRPWKAALLAALVIAPAQAETVFVTAGRMVDMLAGRVVDKPRSGPAN